MAESMDKRMVEVEKDLAAHLAECSLQNKMMWHELRGLKTVVWGAFVGSFSVLLLIVGLFLKNHLHL